MASSSVSDVYDNRTLDAEAEWRMLALPIEWCASDLTGVWLERESSGQSPSDDESDDAEADARIILGPSAPSVPSAFALSMDRRSPHECDPRMELGLRQDFFGVLFQSK